MTISRRGFLAGILAAGTMPSIIAGGLERGILMPGKASIWVPDLAIELPRFLGLDLVNRQAHAVRPGAMDYDPNGWNFEATAATTDASGPTQLIAGMRARVASRFGEEVPDTQ